MFRLACLTASTAIALCASAAAAQITADDAWASIEAQYAAMGVTLDATLTRDGNVLTVSGISGRLVLPQGLGSLSVATGDVIMTENADGSVNAVMPPAYVVDVGVDLSIEGERFNLGVLLDVATQDYAAVMTGTPGAVNIQTSVGLLEATLSEVRLPPDLQADVGIFDVDFYVMAEGMTASTTIVTDGAVALQVTGSVDRTVTDTSFVAGDVVSTSVSLTEGASYTGSIQFPATPIDLANLAAALRGGLALDLSTTSGATISQSVAKAGGLMVTDQGQSLASLVQTLLIDDTGINTLTAFTGLDLNYSIADLMPMPVGVSLAEGSFQFAMPLLAAPEASPARFTLTLDTLEVDPSVWDMIAPGASVMNGPLDLTLDIAAMMRWRTDVLDFIGLADAIEMMEIVAEFPSFTLDTLQASFGGATVTGSGNATLDWEGIDAMWQLDDPVGGAQYIITGANVLLDRLAGTGLVGAQEMLGIRGGLAMAGRPTGPDELTGELSFGPDGLLLNGVRVD